MTRDNFYLIQNNTNKFSNLLMQNFKVSNFQNKVFNANICVQKDLYLPQNNTKKKILVIQNTRF